MKGHKLDKEELAFLESVERGEWKSIKFKRGDLKHYMEMARNTLRKDKRVNIRISEGDLKAIKVKAAQEGLPYQTLMASVLHKYITGQLKPAT